MNQLQGWLVQPDSNIAPGIPWGPVLRKLVLFTSDSEYRIHGAGVPTRDLELSCGARNLVTVPAPYGFEILFGGLVATTVWDFRQCQIAISEVIPFGWN